MLLRTSEHMLAVLALVVLSNFQFTLSFVPASRSFPPAGRQLPPNLQLRMQQVSKQQSGEERWQNLAGIGTSLGQSLHRCVSGVLYNPSEGQLECVTLFDCMFIAY